MIHVEHFSLKIAWRTRGDMILMQSEPVNKAS